MSTCDTTVDAPKVVVNHLALDVCRTQAVQNRIKRPVAVPFVKQPINRSPMAELWRKITPWRTRAKNPQDAMECDSRIGWWSPSRFAFREQIFNTFPLVIGQAMSCHRILHDQRKQNYPQITDGLQQQFSNRYQIDHLSSMKSISRAVTRTVDI